MRVGFIVEGPSERVIIESKAFSDWLGRHGMSLARPVVVALGSGGMGRVRVERLAELLRKQAEGLDRLVVLADLDPAPQAGVLCISDRKSVIGVTSADLVVIARKALESWFLADTMAMRHWTADDGFHEPSPEDTPGTPWERLKEIGLASSSGRGPGVARSGLRSDSLTDTASALHGPRTTRAVPVPAISLRGWAGSASRRANIATREASAADSIPSTPDRAKLSFGPRPAGGQDPGPSPRPSAINPVDSTVTHMSI